MLTKTRAIVLRSLKYGDKKLFVDMFTHEYGMLTFSSPVSSRGKARGKTNCFQPLNIVEVEFDAKPKAEIHTVRDVRIAYPARSIPFDAHKIAISMFLAEFLVYALAKEQTNRQLYSYVENSIVWLDSANRQFANFHLVFMMDLSHFIGFHPDMDGYSPGTWFDMLNGEFSPLIPRHKDVVAPADASVIPVIDRLNYATMHLLKLSREQRNQCAESMLKYYRLHLPSFPELKSFAVMRELFA